MRGQLSLKGDGGGLANGSRYRGASQVLSLQNKIRGGGGILAILKGGGLLVLCRYLPTAKLQPRLYGSDCPSFFLTAPCILWVHTTAP